MNPAPGSKNGKADTPSRQYDSPVLQSVEENILSPACVIGEARWEIERVVLDAQQGLPTPEGCPPGRMFVPPAVRTAILQWWHESRVACHPGFLRSLSLLRQRFWWPSMAADTKGFVAACSICARGKSSHRAQAGLLRPLPVPHWPWSHIAVDFVTGLLPSDGNTVVLSIIDRFSKAVHFVPLSKLPSALEKANLLVLHVFRLHVSPRTFCRTGDRSSPHEVGRRFVRR